MVAVELVEVREVGEGVGEVVVEAGAGAGVRGVASDIQEYNFIIYCLR